MNEQDKIDPIDEMLSILWLETADNFDNELAQKNLHAILSGNYSIEMSSIKKNELINKLYGTVENVSLGQLITAAITETKRAEEDLAKESQLPFKTFSELKNDEVFPNNIPILLLRNLLKQLNISYNAAEQAIVKTFDIMKNRDFVSSYISQPSFRKSQSSSRDSLMKIYKTDGRELFENEEALNKYLLKLKELMK